MSHPPAEAQTLNIAGNILPWDDLAIAQLCTDITASQVHLFEFYLLNRSSAQLSLHWLSETFTASPVPPDTSVLGREEDQAKGGLLLEYLVLKLS